MTFDKIACFDKIRAIAKEKNIKIGDLEDSANVSRGYISRAERPENGSPSIETIVAMANVLDVSVDYLVSNTSDTITKNEKLVIDFLEKLAKQTNTSEIEWACASVNSLIRTSSKNFTVNFPLIDVYKVDTDDGFEYCSYYSSHYHTEAVLEGSCYYTKFGAFNTDTVYLFRVSYPFDKHKTVFTEVYISSLKSVTALCTTYNVKPYIVKSVDTLYELAAATDSHIVIDSNMRATLESFVSF